MTGPIGGVFYYELKYGTSKGSITAGQNLIETFNNKYSSEEIDKEVIGTGDGLTDSFAGTLDFTPIKTQTDACTGTTSPASGEGLVLGGAVKVFVGETGVSGVDDGEGNISGDGVSGTVDYTTGAVQVDLGTAPAEGVEVYSNYVYDSECNSNIPEVNLELTLCEIRAKTRKLKALWCSEAADDLKAYHGLDAEAELVAGLASEIALEIDREIIQDIRSGVVASNIFQYNAAVPAGTNAVDHFRNLVTQVSKASNRIHKVGKRGPANWVVTGSSASVILEQLQTHGDYRPIFAPSNGETTSPAEQPQTFGVYKAGTLSNRWTVYKDIEHQDNELLVGYKGQQFVDAGYVFAPYVPLQITATFLDPANLQFRKAMRTRYATKLVRNELYARVNISNLP